MSENGLNRLARSLAVVSDGVPARRAAELLLSSVDPEEMIDRLYPLLMWHKCLGHALEHLSAVGADLDRLSVSRERFRSTFPVAGRKLWSADFDRGGDRIPLSHLRSLLARHKRFLGDAVAELLGAGSAGVALLSGRAIEAVFPEYGRTEFDSDLLTSDVDSGLDLLERLAARGYRLRFARAREAGRMCEASAEILREGHSVTVGLEMGGYAALGGSVLRRLRPVRWRGLDLMAPCTEDLLLMAAARARSQRSVQWVGVNDAAVMVSLAGAEIDWQLLWSLARRHGLQVHLALLLESAEEAHGEPLVPPEAREHLRIEGFDARLLNRLRALEPWSPESSGRMSTGGLAGRLVARRTRRTAMDPERRPRGAVRGLLQRLAYRTELRLMRSLPASLAPLFGWLRVLRPRLGSLCELRDVPLDPDAAFCLSDRRRPADERFERLRALAVRLPAPGRRPHDCYHYEYRL